jgi:metacaspase-1
MARTALCIGINDYPGTKMDLRGCVNDATDWAAELEARGYAVQRLLDAAAKREAMLAAMRDVISGARAGDHVVITFAGHGTYAPDESGDEDDGLDEGLCPYDVKAEGPILDDEIHELFASRTPGVRLVLVSDSCHSGTVTRAPAADPDPDTPRPRFMPMGNWISDERLARATAPGKATRKRTVRSPWKGSVSRAEGDVLLAGCEEGPDNYSYDAVIAGRPNGAFTYYALKALRRLGADATYAQWHEEIRRALPSASYRQAPQLFGAADTFDRPVFG